MKFSTILGLAAVAVSGVSANTPPACVLACVADVTRQAPCSALNEYSCICSTHGGEVEKCLGSKCPSSVSDPVSAFRSLCKANNQSVGGSASASHASASSSKPSAVPSASGSAGVSAAAGASGKPASTYEAKPSGAKPAASHVSPVAPVRSSGANSPVAQANDASSSGASVFGAVVAAVAVFYI